MRKNPASIGTWIAVFGCVGVLSIAANEALAQQPSGTPIVVIGNASQAAKVRAAVGFWNRELAALGISYRLGSVSQVAPGPGSSQYETERRPGSLVVVFTGNARGGGHNSGRARSQRGAVVEMRGEGSALVTHEMGHSLGLLHSASHDSVMHARGNFVLTLGSDDKARLLALHGGRQARQ
jgi:Matrixin